MKLKSLFGIATVLLIAGCGSMSKDAKSLMEKGDYADAIPLWDQVLKNDPNDAEAARLRKIAQEELLNTDLVTLKGTIDAHQTLQAFDQLTQINDKRKNWNLGVNPNSSRYLKELVERLYGQYMEMLRQENTAGHPLKVLYLAKHYRELLQTKIIDDEKLINDTAHEQGLHQCKDLEENSKTNDNLRIYAIAFCNAFGKSIALSSAQEKRLQDQLLKFPNVVSKIDGFDSTDNLVLAHALVQVAQRTPEFSAQGNKDSSLTIGGTFVQTPTQKPVQMSHSYIVQVPYTKYTTVNNPTSEAYIDGNGNTQYRSVDHFETLTETAYRDDPRVYVFEGTELDQTIHFTLQSNLKSTLLSIGLPFEDRFDEKILTHHENLPDIGLSPQPGALKTKEAWLQNELPKLSDAIENQLNQVWIQKHCAGLANLKTWKLADHVFECMRSEHGKKESLVANWFVTQTGLSPDNAIEIIGKLRYL